MATDELRARYLRDKVMTATPAQRVVMLYDRLGLDLNLAARTDDIAERGSHLSHAMQIVTELRGSLDLSVGGPAESLAAVYSQVLVELIAIRGGALQKLATVSQAVTELRSTWAQVAEITAASANPAARTGGAGAWVG